jgi:hypothetical protein
MSEPCGLANDNWAGRRSSHAVSVDDLPSRMSDKAGRRNESRGQLFRDPMNPMEIER